MDTFVDNSEWIEALINIVFVLGLLAVGYFSGTRLERKHYRDIIQREKATRDTPATTFVPDAWEITESTLVQGNIVVSLDYFKRFLATLRGIFGGRIKAYEPLLDRARREAILRMKESAIQGGYDAVINVRLETSRLASSRSDGKGTSGVEMLAFGTAVKFQRRL